jgi:hypothetical protein
LSTHWKTFSFLIWSASKPNDALLASVDSSNQDAWLSIQISFSKSSEGKQKNENRSPQCVSSSFDFLCGPNNPCAKPTLAADGGRQRIAKSKELDRGSEGL